MPRYLIAICTYYCLIHFNDIKHLAFETEQFHTVPDVVYERYFDIMKFIIANDIKSAGRYKSDGISLFEADSHLICKAQSVVCLGKILLLISGLLLFVIGAWGQRVNKITTNEGLSQGFVIGIEQGRNGFIWATSLNGLNRFDGENFKIYKHHPSDSLSLASDIVSRLLKDIEGHIWVLNNKSFQVYDEIRDGFVTPAYFKKQPLTTNGSIIFDELNRLWVFEGDTIFGYSIMRPKNWTMKRL